MIFFIFIILGFCLTFFGIRLFLNWSKKREILDIPNERSSHLNPTPVGGGLIIVGVILSLYLLFLVSEGKEIPWTYFCAAILVAGVSWFDDLYSLPVYIRFFFHSIAALLVIFGLSVSESIYVPSIGVLQVGNFVYFIWFLWIVWLINAYNFMDGIDGIAGVQAVTAGIGWVITGYVLGAREIIILGILTVVTNLAFLIYNWQPAKVFMGDVGSAFLGFTFAVFPFLILEKKDDNSNALITTLLLSSILFVWLFVFDSVRTVLVRLLKGEKIWQAHRSHLYQKLVIEGFSHRFVTILYGLLSVFVMSFTIFSLYFGGFDDFFLYIMVGSVSGFLLIFTLYKSKNLSRI